MTNAKAKGSAFERSVCRMLSQWISNGTREDLFWRSAMSGGRATVAGKRGKELRAQCGDITAVDPMGNILTDMAYIECKHLKQCSLDDLVKDNIGEKSLLTIWHIARNEAEKYDKHPVLIFRQNRWPIVLCTDHHGVDFFGATFNVFAAAPPHSMNFIRFEELIQKPFHKLKAVRKRR